MRTSLPRFFGARRNGFTLLELLAAIAILAIMITLLFAAFGQASRAWLQSENRVETFSQARSALDFMSKELSQAIVSSNITFLGDTNDIAFVAPLNIGTNAVDLMEVVYRMNIRTPRGGTYSGNVFSNAPDVWPKSLVRRTSHFAAPANEGWDYGQGRACTAPPWDFYTSASGTPNPNWPETSATNRTVVIADNVMGINFEYFDASNSLPQIFWNSNPTLPGASWQHELQTPIPQGTTGLPGPPSGIPIMTNRSPASVQITLYMIDSKAAARLQGITPSSPAFTNIVNQALKTFSTVVAIPNHQP